VSDAANAFGKQCVVVGIDVRREEGEYRIYTHGGRKPTDLSLIEYIERMETAGAGEFLINSIDNDGMMQGYDHELLRRVRMTTLATDHRNGGSR